MYGLTILQPWASLLLHGIKEYETRPWQYWKKLQDERIALHAGKGRAGWRIAMTDPDLMAALRALPQDDLPEGAIIGTAVLAYQMETHGPMGQQQSAREHALGDWRPGRWAWALRDIVPVTPIRCAGQQGFWRVPEDVMARLECAA